MSDIEDIELSLSKACTACNGSGFQPHIPSWYCVRCIGSGLDRYAVANGSFDGEMQQAHDFWMSKIRPPYRFK